MSIKIKKNEENPETPEVLAESIIRIDDSFEKLLSTRLKQRAIVALLKGMPGMTTVSKTEIDFILDNLKTLKGYYLRDKK